MKKIIVAPDSFKGTLSSEQVCKILRRTIGLHFSHCEVISVPIADGGEGSVACFVSALNGEVVKCRSRGPYFEEIDSFFGLVNNGKTAVIEMAATAGLPLVGEKKNPLITTTYGVGVLIKEVVNRGVKDIILALGGSATNDFGCGAASALGVRFYDKDGKTFIPTGATLKDVSRIEPGEQIKNVNITLMCDVKNRVFGERGAAYVYAPQKGAGSDDVKHLDEGLKHICRVVESDIGIDVSCLEGGGAAGAMAAGMVAFFGAELKMGIDAVLDTVGFDELLDGADLVFTGEGKIDSQSIEGKVVSGVAKRSKEKAVPVIAIVGGADGDLSALYDIGINSVFTINRLPEDFSISRYKSEENLSATADNILRLLRVFEN